MNDSAINFKVTKLRAQVDEPVMLRWRGTEVDAGALTVELDKNVSGTGNQGALDYSRRRARAEFHVCLSFPDLASTLGSLDVDHELTQPLRAVIHSEGEILDDHSFVLSGGCDLQPHALFPREETMASVLPGL